MDQNISAFGSSNDESHFRRRKGECFFVSPVWQKEADLDLDRDIYFLSKWNSGWELGPTFGWTGHVDSKIPVVRTRRPTSGGRYKQC